MHMVANPHNKIIQLIHVISILKLIFPLILFFLINMNIEQIFSQHLVIIKKKYETEYPKKITLRLIGKKVGCIIGIATN